MNPNGYPTWGAALNAMVGQSGLHINEFARIIGTGPEYLRRTNAGLGPDAPNQLWIRRICQEFDVHFEMRIDDTGTRMAFVWEDDK